MLLRAKLYLLSLSAVFALGVVSIGFAGSRAQYINNNTNMPYYFSVEYQCSNGTITSTSSGIRVLPGQSAFVLGPGNCLHGALLRASLTPGGDVDKWLAVGGTHVDLAMFFRAQGAPLQFSANGSASGQLVGSVKIYKGTPSSK